MISKELKQEFLEKGWIESPDPLLYFEKELFQAETEEEAEEDFPILFYGSTPTNLIVFGIRTVGTDLYLNCHTIDEAEAIAAKINGFEIF